MNRYAVPGSISSSPATTENGQEPAAAVRAGVLLAVVAARDPKVAPMVVDMAHADLTALRQATQRLVDLTNRVDAHYDGSATLSDEDLSQMLIDASAAVQVWRDVFEISIIEARSRATGSSSLG